ncbi:MAG: asparagine synthase (glutamine-hydrolyzing), partial [Imperialibacter sp.]
MCGIAGSFSINGRLEDRTVRDVLSKLKHRGPDANGFFNSDSKTLTLLHSRLSIIDLNARSNQPFHSSCGRFVMVYNGELYNFNELIREMNMRPKTSSDTEVVLEVFLRYGIEGVAKFDGMFAFAIYDKQDEVVWMARDRIGEKPLYYSRQEGFAFASELKALLPMLQQLPKINHSAVRAFLHVGYVPAAQSIYDNIFKFPAGSYGVADLKGNLSITRYWNISEALSSETISDEEEALTKLEQLITSSVSSRLVSDVPYGAFLSGGVDSSLVCAVASRLSDSKLNTFSIGFENKAFNETYYSKSVAAHLGTNHHEFLLKEMQAVDLLDNLMEVYDEPFADSSAISTLMVASLAAPHVKMVLSGDGGDELFHGYGSYMWANRLEKKYIKAAGKLIRATLRLHPSGRAKRASSLFGHTYDEGERNHIFSQESYFFSNEEIDTLMINKAKGGNFIYSNKLKLPRELLGSEK